jgi:hypothetical protein
MDPIGFATTVEDETGPLWGEPLVEHMRAFRRWIGMLVMVNDDNHGTVELDEGGNEVLTAAFDEDERARLDAAFDFTRSVFDASGASRGAGRDS